MFQQTYDRIRSQIDELVSTDPNAFYTSDEYNEAAEMLVQVVALRAESVTCQLDGTIPSTDSAQKSSDALIDASAIDISVMGGMGGGRGGEQKENGAPGNGNDGFGGFPGEHPEGMQAPQAGNGKTQPELPDNTAASQDSTPDTSPSDDNVDSVADVSDNSETALTDSNENTRQESGKQSTSESSDQSQNHSDFRPGGFGGGQQDFPGAPGDTESSGTPTGLVSLLVSAGVIAAGLTFAFLFRANRR